VSMFNEFNPSEISDAIANGTKLGTGGYGSVYSAEIRKISVAIKINDDGSQQGKREFMQEASTNKYSLCS
jgi:hypothetical protein